MKHSRKINWRNVGWATSWGLFFTIVVPATIVAVVSLLTTGHNPVAEQHTGLFVAVILITAWVAIRNPIPPTEYIRRWKATKR